MRDMEFMRAIIPQHASKARELTRQRVEELRNLGKSSALENTITYIEEGIELHAKYGDPDSKWRAFWFKDGNNQVVSVPWFKRGITKDVIKHFEEQGYKVSYNWFLNYLTFKW